MRYLYSALAISGTKTRGREGLSGKTLSQARMKPSMALLKHILCFNGFRKHLIRQPLLARLSTWSAMTTLALLSCSSYAYSLDWYADLLYWQASETADWVLTNNLSTPNQQVAYKTISFNNNPGFRVGVGQTWQDWDTKVLYTRFNSKTTASASSPGLTAVFLGGKLAEPLYQSGHIRFSIDFNMFDVTASKAIPVDSMLQIKPMIGLRGGWIDQHISTTLNGTRSNVENINNDFTGVGPIAGVESLWTFYQKNEHRLSLAADFAASFMWGRWGIDDMLTRGDNLQHIRVHVGKRHSGAFALQGLMGLHWNYKHYAVKLGYEISDWFDQYQVLDDGTGTHNNDLILQGLTLSLHARC